MRAIFICFFACLFADSLRGQVTLHVQLPPSGLVMRDQLWNIVVSNNSGSSVDMSMELSLKQAVSGQIVLTGAAPPISFPLGLKILTASDMQGVQYNTVAMDFSGNFLPLGSYIACYRLTRSGGESPELVAEECVPVHVQPLSPPELHFPGNGEVLMDQYPQFIWISPTPVEMFGELQYDLLVTEVLEGQSATEAIIYNNPVFASSYITHTQERYPPSYFPLDTGRLYAWRVVARNGFEYSAQTEVWTFKVRGQDGGEVASPNTIYREMKLDNTSSVVQVSNGILAIKVNVRKKATPGIFKVLDGAGAVVQVFERELRAGYNFLQFELNGQMQKGLIYRLLFQESEGKSYSLPFSIQ